MSGIRIFLLLTVIAVLPLVIVFFWFKARKFHITLPWFLAAIVTGIISLFAAALIQNFFPEPENAGLGTLLFGVFIRIAVIEEASRFLTFIPLLKTGNRLCGRNTAFGPALGLVAGLGFAALENASYGMADINITMLRVFTAAPLHGACGIRIGEAVSKMSRSTAKAIFLFISAVIIHGTYNLIIVSPAIPSILAVAAAFIAFFASIHLLNPSSPDSW